MTNLDVAGLLVTYAKKCSGACSDKNLKEIIRDLKYELRYEEIKKMQIIKD